MELRKFFKKQSNLGLAPGTIIVDEQDKQQCLANVSIEKIIYNEQSFAREKVCNIEKELSDFKEGQVTWVNINSSAPALVSEIGRVLNIHPLVQEDIVNTDQRPKFEDWDNYGYVVLKMFSFNKALNDSEQEQVSFIIGDNFLISFQERPGDVFEAVRKRLVNNKGRIRKMQADYLMYCLMDSVVDQYFVVLDRISEQVVVLEDIVDDDPNTENLKKIQRIKQEVIFIRRFTVPVKELVLSLIKSEASYIRGGIIPFLGDLQDHSSQVVESIEMLRDLIVSVLEIASSALSNKMNDIMKVLTIISTIFIPITFIAGIYGMNFEIPELKYQHGYQAVLGLMLVLVIAMLIYFKKKKWL